jgi:hypothetical protein
LISLLLHLFRFAKVNGNLCCWNPALCCKEVQSNRIRGRQAIFKNNKAQEF